MGAHFQKFCYFANFFETLFFKSFGVDNLTSLTDLFITHIYFAFSTAFRSSFTLLFLPLNRICSLFFLNIVCEKIQTEVKRKAYTFSPVLDVDVEEYCFFKMLKKTLF